MNDEINTTATANETAAERDGEALAPIPDELEGIPEDIAREVMGEAADGAEPAEDDGTGEEAEESDDVSGVAKETGTEEEAELPDQKIPYARFKQKVNEVNALKAEIAELKKIREQQAQTPPPPAYQAPAAPPPPVQPALTADQATAINNRIRALAQEMTGLSQEDIDALEYADDSDPNKSRWQSAIDIARTSVIIDIRNSAARAAQERQQFLAQHQESMDTYAEFEKSQMAEPDFNDISLFAQNEYYQQLGKIEQRAIADAYNRVCRRVASPQDVFLVTRYYSTAKAAYRAKQAQDAAAKNKPKPSTKKAPPPTRFNQVGGTVDSNKGLSLEQIENMMHERPFDQLPKDLQTLLLTGGA